MSEPVPVFTTEHVGGRPLIVCMLGEHKGTARITSTGEDAAKQRAETQARDKARAAG